VVIKKNFMDGRMRGFERAAAGGDAEAGGRLLLDRVRIGELSPEKLQLASYLGEERARIALGEREKIRFEGKHHGFPDKSCTDLAEWVKKIIQIDNLSAHEKKEALMRVSIASVRTVLPLVKVLEQSESEEAQSAAFAATLAIESLEQWVLDYQQHSSRVTEAADLFAEHFEEIPYDASKAARDVKAANRAAYGHNRYEGVLDTVMREDHAMLAASMVVKAAYMAVEAASRDVTAIDGVASDAGVAAAQSAKATNWEPDAPREMSWNPATIGAAKVQRAIQDELVSWALGEGDPVKDRVEARNEEG
jgi:hypothetical protein